jgi:cardiolipin synthase
VLATAVLATTLAACAQLPPRDARTHKVATSQLGTALRVSDARGTLGAASAQSAAASVAAEGRPDLALHHLSVLAAQGDAHLFRGNAARVLVDGPQSFAAIRAAIETARSRVLVEAYIFEDDGLAAEMGQLLVRKASEGVGVALLYDSVGSRGSSSEFFDTLRAGGVAVCAFNPVNPLARPGYWGINHRDHRKLFLADDRVGITGGLNISKVYAAGSSSRSADERDWRKKGWRDTQIELRGPAVPALAQAFESHWRSQGCKDALPPAPQPAASNAGTKTVQLLLSHPDDETNPIYESLLQAIDASRRSVHLTMAYFAPGEDMARSLCDAARRGVDVVLILPSRSDFSLMLAAGRSYYDELLAAGVRIYELQSAMLHAKTAVIDGVWSTVGSSNMDWRSFAANSEANVVVLGDDFARSLEALFERDIAESRPITADEWAQRGFGSRLREQLGRIAERLF